MDFIVSPVPIIGNWWIDSIAAWECVSFTVWMEPGNNTWQSRRLRALWNSYEFRTLSDGRVELVRNSVKSRNYLPRDQARSLNCTRRTGLFHVPYRATPCSIRASSSTEVKKESSFTNKTFSSIPHSKSEHQSSPTLFYIATDMQWIQNAEVISVQPHVLSQALLNWNHIANTS